MEARNGRELERRAEAAEARVAELEAEIERVCTPLVEQLERLGEHCLEGFSESITCATIEPGAKRCWCAGCLTHSVLEDYRARLAQDVVS